MEGIENLMMDFYNNGNLCTNSIELNIGEDCCVIDTSLIDPSSEEYAYIPCTVVGMTNSNIPGRKYYFFQAKESYDDENLNTITDPSCPVPFYRILENTSPAIIRK